MKKYVVGIDWATGGGLTSVCICRFQRGRIFVEEFRRYKTNNLNRIIGYLRRRYKNISKIVYERQKV